MISQEWASREALSWQPWMLFSRKHVAVLKTRSRMPARWQLSLISLSGPAPSAASRTTGKQWRGRWGLLWFSLAAFHLIFLPGYSFQNLRHFLFCFSWVCSLVPEKNWPCASSAMHAPIPGRTELNRPAAQMITRLLHHFLHWDCKQRFFLFLNALLDVSFPPNSESN